MNLSSPVTIQPPSIARKSGEVRSFKPITLNSLDITIMDNAARKSCIARVHPCPFPLTLWSGSDYDAAGDYTQAQVEARVLELLGSDLKAGLEGLFVMPVR
jgi:hypothetical protein